MKIQKKNTPINNLAKNIICEPNQIFYSINKQKLSNIVKTAYKKKKNIRAIGTLHSWSPILCAEYLINTDKLNRILYVNQNNVEV